MSKIPSGFVSVPIARLFAVRSISEMYEALYKTPCEYVGVSANISFDINQSNSEVVLPADFIYKNFIIDVFEGDLFSSIKLCTADWLSVEHTRIDQSPYTFTFQRNNSTVLDEREQMVLKITYKTDSGVSFRRVHANVTLIRPEYRDNVYSRAHLLNEDSALLL